MFVYRLISPSGKSYIGQTKREPIRRFSQHCLAWKRWIREGRKRKSYDTKLFYAFDKYPPEQWKVFELCGCSCPEYLDREEAYYVKYFDSKNNGYNLTDGGQGLRGLIISDDHKRNQSEARKAYYQIEEGKAWLQKLSERYKKDNPGAESRRGKPSWNRGMKHTEEAKQRISESGKKSWENASDERREQARIQAAINGRKNKGRVLSDERKAQISEQLKGRASSDVQKQKAREANQKQWVVISPDGERHEITNLRQFCKERKLGDGNLIKFGHTKGWKLER
jgi:hypothetical protein